MSWNYKHAVVSVVWIVSLDKQNQFAPKRKIRRDVIKYNKQNTEKLTIYETEQECQEECNILNLIH
jgi:hypothetical protein